MDRIRSFRKLSAEQEACAGGKGRGLARLAQAGYPVPDGLIILPMAFSGDELLPAAWTAVQAHLNRMRRGDPGMAFAVRSSAVSEDSARASFAGQFESVLDVATDEAVRQAIHAVRRSRHSQRVRGTQAILLPILLAAARHHAPLLRRRGQAAPNPDRPDRPGPNQPAADQPGGQ